ncbi:MAG: hypothetical protein PWQ57_3400 [Desulfovibrionales bacterium]|nr:hypothetical protein [Desulfovibrionales bacterium]
MDLKDFLAESLKQIIGGIKDAQEYAKEQGGRVSPPISSSDKNKSLHVHLDPNITPSFVKFDLSVATASDITTGKEGGIKVLSAFVAKADGSTSSSSQAVSRIQFEIPVVWPPDKK